MLALTFTDLVSWIIAHGYFIFFFTALVEGPLVTTAAGVAAALGYYNIIIIVLIAIAGGDTIREVQRAVFNDANIVIVWKEFYQRSAQTSQIAEEFLREIR